MILGKTQQALKSFDLDYAVIVAVVLLLTGFLFLCLITNPLYLVPIAAAGAGLWLAMHPNWLWLSLLGLLPFSMEVKSLAGAGNNVTLPTELLTPLVILSIGIYILRDGKLRWTLSPLHTAALVFIGLQCLSLIVSQLPVVTVKTIVRSCSGFVGGYLLTQMAVRSWRDLRGIALIFALTTTTLVLYGFFTQFIEGVQIYQDIAHPFFDDHCVYAAYLCFPAGFILAWLTQPAGGGKLALQALLGLLGLAILLTFVRGAWIGLLAGALVLLARAGARLSLRFLLFLMAAVLAGTAIVLFLGLEALMQERWQTLFDLRFVSNESRIDRWMAALSMFLSRPIFGVGLGCYPDLYYQHVYNVHSYEGGLHMGAHNLWLEILAEMGILGLAAYAAMIFAFFVETRRMRQLDRGNPAMRGFSLGLETMMIIYLTHTLVNNLGPSDKIDICFWTTLGLASAVRCLIQKEKQNSPVLEEAHDLSQKT